MLSTKQRKNNSKYLEIMYKYLNMGCQFLKIMFYNIYQLSDQLNNNNPIVVTISYTNYISVVNEI